MKLFKKDFTQQGFLKISRQKIRIAIFAGVFGLIGVGGVLYSQAATYPSVRFILLCAADEPCRHGPVSVTKYGQDVYEWYRTNNGQRTFRLLAPKIVTSKLTKDQLLGADNYDPNKRGRFDAMFQRLYDHSEIKEDNVITIAFIGFTTYKGNNNPKDFDVPCGTGGGVRSDSGNLQRGFGVVEQFYGGCAGNNVVIAAAHELGHNFMGRPHVANTIMADPVLCSATGLRTCKLNSNQVTQLSKVINSKGQRWLFLGASSYLEAQSGGEYSSPTNPSLPPLQPEDPNDGADTTPRSAAAPSPGSVYGDSMFRNNYLTRGKYIQSSNGAYRMTLESGGLFAVFRVSDNRIMWQPSGSRGNPHRITLELDGNLVATNECSAPVWHSATSDSAAVRLILSNDGALTLYKETANSGYQAVWSSTGGRLYSAPNDGRYVDPVQVPAPPSCNTSPPTSDTEDPVPRPSPVPSPSTNNPYGHVMFTNNILHVGKYLQSSNGQWRMHFNGYAAIIIEVRNGVEYWGVQKNVMLANPSPGAYIIMQSDGNLVMYNSANLPSWNSGTHGTGAVIAALENTGKLVIYKESATSSYTPVWSSP